MMPKCCVVYNLQKTTVLHQRFLPPTDGCFQVVIYLALQYTSSMYYFFVWGKKSAERAELRRGGRCWGGKNTLLMPLDTIKTQAQIERGVSSSFVAIVRRIAASESGFSSFYFGYSAALLQQIGKVGVQFGAFESWRNALRIALDDVGESEGVALNAASGALAGATEALYGRRRRIASRRSGRRK